MSFIKFVCNLVFKIICKLRYQPFMGVQWKITVEKQDLVLIDRFGKNSVCKKK